MDAKGLKEIRETVGLSQRELAERAGVSKALIGHIETGERPMTDRVKHRLLTAILSVTDEQMSRFENLSRELIAI